MRFVGIVAVNALARGMLPRVTQWPWIDHPTFQLGGGHSATELVADEIPEVYSIMSHRQTISSCLYVRLKGTCSLAGRALANTGY